MARPRQPVDLIVHKGRKHLTKEEIEERRAQEVKAPSDNVEAPEYLTQEMKWEFDEIALQLIDIGIMSNLDIDALARFIFAKYMYLKITQKIIEDEMLIFDKEVMATQDRLFKQSRSAAMDLGLTISSRCRLVVPKKEESKPQSKFSRFGG